MQRKWIFTIALLLILLSILLIIVPNSLAFAHNGLIVDTPTPTPDANVILNKANDASNQTQTLITYITIGLAVVGAVLAVLAIFITAITIITGILAFLGFSSVKDINELKEQMRQDAEATRSSLLKDVNDLKEQIRQDMANVRQDAEATRSSLVYLGLGDRLMNKGSVKEAIVSYRKAGTFSPKDDQINYVLGRIYNSAGYFDDAISAFSRATQTNSDFAEAWKELGLAYRRRGEQLKEPNDYDAAIEYLKKSLTLKPDDDDTYAIIGGLYRRLEDYKRSLANYEQAYRINPASSYALSNMASLSWYLGEIADAKKYFTDAEIAANTRIVKGTPEGYWDYYDLALSQLILDNTDAMNSYKQAIANTPTPGKVAFESVLDNLLLLQKASTRIPGLSQVIQLIEDAKSKSL